MDTNTQILWHNRPTTRTHLRRPAWINKHYCSASLYRFARTSLCELMPRHVTDASIHAAIITALHLLHGEFLKRQQLITIHQPPCRLVGEVIPPIGDTSVNMLHYPLMFLACRGAIYVFTEPPLGFDKCRLVTLKEAGVLYLATVRQGSKVSQSDINPHNAICLGQGLRFHDTRKRSIPLTHSIPANRQGFGFPVELPVHLNFDVPNLGQPHSLSINKKPVAFLLGISKGVIPVCATKAGIARFLACFDTTEERTKSQVHSFLSILHSLSMAFLQPCLNLLPLCRQFLRVVPAKEYGIIIPSILTNFDGFVVYPAAAVKLLLQESNLRFSRVYLYLNVFRIAPLSYC